MSKRRPYEEGSWFLVPVAEGRYASGIITRISPTASSVLLGYFFEELFTTPPSLERLCCRAAQDTDLVMVFGYLGLKEGTWPVIGRCENWNREAWPTPTFEQRDPLTGMRREIWRDDNNPNNIIGSRNMDPDDNRKLPSSMAWGDGAVQLMLAKRLGLYTQPLDTSKLPES